MSAEAFPFLELPPEIRLMVYEHLPLSIKHVHVKINDPPSQAKAERSLTFVTRSVPVSILRTCRLIYTESHAIVSKLVASFIPTATPKVMCTSDLLCDMSPFLDTLTRSAPSIRTSSGGRYAPSWRAVLEEQGLVQGFLKWAEQPSRQQQHHRKNGTICKVQIVVKIIPSTAALESYIRVRDRILDGVWNFAVAGFIESEDGEPPVYYSGLELSLALIYYHIGDNKRVYRQMDVQTWWNEWLE